MTKDLENRIRDLLVTKTLADMLRFQADRHGAIPEYVIKSFAIRASEMTLMELGWLTDEHDEITTELLGQLMQDTMKDLNKRCAEAGLAPPFETLQ